MSRVQEVTEDGVTTNELGISSFTTNGGGSSDIIYTKTAIDLGFSKSPFSKLSWKQL